MRDLRAATAAAGVALLVVCTALPAAAAAPTSPDDVPTPTTRQLAASVHVWQPGGVHRWDLSGSVRVLEVADRQGQETVLTLSSDILFGFGSAELPPAAGPRIAELVADVPQGAAVRVTGHTDSVADEAFNLVLSQRRAQAVATAVAGARPDLALDVQGRGEAEPVASNGSPGRDDPAGRALNRRVEIRYEG